MKMNHVFTYVPLQSIPFYLSNIITVRLQIYFLMVLEHSGKVPPTWNSLVGFGSAAAFAISTVSGFTVANFSVQQCKSILM
jgi:hypothetical protein